MENIEYVIVAV